MIHFLLNPPEVCSNILDKFIKDYDGKSFIETHYYIDSIECEVSQKIELLHYFCKNQRLRWTAKKFIFKFMERRKKNAKYSRNSTGLDLEEFSPDDRLIKLFSTDSKLKYYTFKFGDIQRIIKTAITYNYEYVPAPIIPKNPYTGKEFSIQEIVEIFSNFRLNDYDEYSFAFKKSGFNISNYQRMNNNILVKAAINNNVRDLTIIQLYHEVVEIFDSLYHSEYNRTALRNVMTGLLDHNIIEGMRRFVSDYTLCSQLGFYIIKPVTMSWISWAMYIIGTSTMYNKEVLRLETESRKRYREMQEDITRRTRPRTSARAIENERDESSDGWSEFEDVTSYEGIINPEDYTAEDDSSIEDNGGDTGLSDMSGNILPRIRLVVGSSNDETREDFREILRRIFGDVEPPINRESENSSESFWGGEGE
jgi:hypothetical protein